MKKNGEKIKKILYVFLYIFRVFCLGNFGPFSVEKMELWSVLSIF
jgi:hypothetical protein